MKRSVTTFVLGVVLFVAGYVSALTFSESKTGEHPIHIKSRTCAELFHRGISFFSPQSRRASLC